MDRIGIRELRQNLSRYVLRVKAGEAFAVTERGEEVAVLSPSPRHDDELAFLLGELRASPPSGPLDTLLDEPLDVPGPPSGEVLRELREERS
jgi:prevent-host-death family protein